MIQVRNFRRFFYKTLKQPLYAMTVFGKRALVFFYYALFNGKSPMPEAVTLFLTHKCNLRCKMCGQWGESGVTKRQSLKYVKEELTMGELKRLIDDVGPMRPSITLFGGEPLLYKDCTQLVRYIKRNNMHCLMISNGSLLDEYAESLIDAGLDELNISLDGPRELHDEIRGMPGLYGKITGGIKKLNSLKRAKGLKRPLLNLQCTITKYNYMKLEQLLDVALETEADSLTFHNLIFLRKDLIDKQKDYDRLLGASSEDWEGFVFEPEIDARILYDKISYVLANKRKLAVDFYPNLSLAGLNEYYNNPSYLPKEFRALCLSPWMTGYIFPDGEVRPCLNSTYSFGNIRGSGFKKIWNSESALRFRRILKDKRVFPVCARCTELYRY